MSCIWYFITACWMAMNMITLVKVKGAKVVVCEQGSINSSQGTEVKMGSSLSVQCTFYEKGSENCRKTILQDHIELPTKRRNQTAVYSEIKELRVNKTTFVCKTNCNTKPITCGIDIKVGYPPEEPTHLSCIQKGEFGNITCTWQTGRHPLIKTTSLLWVKNKTHKLSFINTNPSFGDVTFSLLDEESQYSVWVIASNTLGNASSQILNFSLQDIVKPYPPRITFINNSFSNMIIYWEEKQNTTVLEIRYRPLNQNWSVHLINDSFERMYILTDLQPFTNYEIQMRTKMSIMKGVWSDWSKPILNRTEEAAPVAKLDYWFLLEYTDSSDQSLIIFWKNLSETESRGFILYYEVELQIQSKTDDVKNVTKNNYKINIPKPSGSILLSAINSKGKSPAAIISLPINTGFPPPQTVTCKPNINSISVFWNPPEKEMTPLQSYVVSWTPHSRKKRDLNWIRLAKDKLSLNISEIHPNVCYKITVFALYDQGIGIAGFIQAISTQSVPTAAPKIEVKHFNRTSIIVIWKAILVEHQKGCVSYNVYVDRLDKVSQPLKYGSINCSKNEFIVKDLEQGLHYQVWMTASMGTAEGQRSEKKTIFLNKEEKYDQLIMQASGIVIVCLLLCVCSTILDRQRIMRWCSVLLPQWFTYHVPDPANCKWAQEFSSNKDQKKFVHSPQKNDSLSSWEEPETFEIEEVLENNESMWDSTHENTANDEGNARLDLLPTCRPEDLIIYKHQLPSPYIRNMSQETEISSDAPEFCDVDYISSNLLHMESSQEESSGFMEDSFSPFPCSPFSEPLILFGGKLTLDAVKIDCNSFLD
uniref:Interleukin 12 receptor subunit beta 2 n=2 Tax=Erpetoichthys calabaricus TaxID=27687 RepID=A0A8C4XAN5_ERPCA